MACVLILTGEDDSQAYYVAGTGFQPSAASATTYATKEGAMGDGVTQREAVGRTAILTVKDLVSGEEHAVPYLR
jgi:hypothetical protein